MRNKAIGMVEFKTVSAGITALDAMVKAADVNIIEAQTVCPGKYIAIIDGDLSAVKSAIDVALKQHSVHLISSFILGNPHDGVFPAIYGTTHIDKIGSLGILETYDGASVIVAADTAAKTSIVDIIEIRIAKGMCGKSYMLITGSVAAVEIAVEKAKKAVAERGMYLDASVISNPDKKLSRVII